MFGEYESQCRKLEESAPNVQTFLHLIDSLIIGFARCVIPLRMYDWRVEAVQVRAPCTYSSALRVLTSHVDAALGRPSGGLGVICW